MASRLSSEASLASAVSTSLNARLRDLGEGRGRLLLFGAAQIDLRCQLAAVEHRIDSVAPTPPVGSSRSWSTKMLLEIDDSAAVSDNRGRRAAPASPTRANEAATRRWAATTSGRRSSSSDGTPVGAGAGNAASVTGNPISAAG